MSTPKSPPGRTPPARERRRHNRVKVSWDARVGGKDIGIATATVTNISISGLFLESTQIYAEGTELMMEISAEHRTQQRKLLMRGNVVRKIEFPNAEVLGYGVRLEQISDDDLFYLLAIVADLWAHSPQARA